MKKLIHAVVLFYVTVFSATVANAYSSKGFYQVPVKERALKKSAVYEIEYNDSDFANLGQVQFVLPSTLTGDNKVFSMKRVNKVSGAFVGENVDGLCTLDKEESIFSCLVVLRKLNIDAAMVEKSIREKFQSESEIKNKILVAKKFSGEPIGILHYKVPRGSYVFED
jgi:hypothetical protein